MDELNEKPRPSGGAVYLVLALFIMAIVGAALLVGSLL